MKGEGIIEYALTFALVIVVIIVILALASIFSSDNPCFKTTSQTTYEYRNDQVEQCLKSEQYSRDECIRLVSGK
jgi:hypothetical protein